MRNRRIFVAIILLLFLTNCNDIKRRDAIGVYVSRNNVNTIDSLWVLDNGEYINLMYRKGDESLIYKNTGKWWFSDGYIVFDMFFKDEDELHGRKFTDFEKVLITTKLPLEKEFGKIIIHHKSMYDNVYLEKVE